MKKNLIKKIVSKSTLSLMLVLTFLASLTYTNGVYALQGTTNPDSIEYWDGTDTYADLDALLTDLGAADDDGYYHIKTANQLHGVIRLSKSAVYKFKLDNDIYLNEDYENYENWGKSAPANTWQFNQSNTWTASNTFTGTIDGCKHTVYGLFSKTSGAYNGLIGATKGTTVIKNLNVKYTYLNGAYRAGVIVGWNSSGSLSVDGCSVSNAYITGGWQNEPSGGILALSQGKTIITNTAVRDIKFTSLNIPSWASSNYNMYPYASFIGGIYLNMQTTASTGSLAKVQAENNIIQNSYAVNTINVTNNNKPVYICGLFSEGNGQKWGYSVTVNNVYTDATSIPVSNKVSPQVKLLVTTNGQSVVSQGSADYPIKTITADSIKGNSAKEAMPFLDWNEWRTVENGYPYYNGPFVLEGVWDGKDNYESLDSLLADLGETDSEGYYHIKTPNQLHAAIRLSKSADLKFKLNNDIYINSGYENYENWGANPPKNTWQFNQKNTWTATDTFAGTIDGCGYTVYGLFSNTNGAYNGLIGATKGTAVVKNLNVRYAYLNGAYRAGGIVGWNVSGSLAVDSCSVRDVFIKGGWQNEPSGGILALSQGKTTITNCAVADVTFTGLNAPSWVSQNYNMYPYASFIGGIYLSMQDVANSGVLATVQAANNLIENCYALNTVNKTDNNKPVYICGLFSEGNGQKWGYSLTARNIYTDASVLPTSTNTEPIVTLLVTTDGQTVVSPSEKDYPIKKITANDIKGASAKTSMPTFDWCKWKIEDNDYPSSQGGHILTHSPLNPATCSEDGTEEHWVCIECNKKFSDAEGKNEIKKVGIIEAINHRNAKHLDEKDSTCTEAGNLESWYCPDCKKYSVESDFNAIYDESEVIIPKTNHVEGKLHYTDAPATCDEDGHIEYWHCTDCDRYYIDEDCENEVEKSRVITEKATGHRSPVYRPATPAGDTCAEPGTIEHFECLDCNKYFEDEACTKEIEFIDAISNKHNSKKVNEISANCDDAGRKSHYECTECHRYFIDANCTKQVSLAKLKIPALKHANAKHKLKSLPTCTTNGYKEHWYCPDCGSYFKRAKLSESNKVDYVTLIIPSPGHKTTEDSVVGYDENQHWIICDVCSEKINCEKHEISDPIAVYDGSEKRCECGYAIQKFNFNINGVKISTDYGVLPADAKFKISKTLNGSAYDKTMYALGDVAEALDVFVISAQRDNVNIIPDSKIKISLPVSKRFSSNIAIYSIDSNGNAKKVNANINRVDEIADLSLYGFGIFAVVDLGVKYNRVEENNNDTQSSNQDDEENSQMSNQEDVNSSTDNNQDTAIDDENTSQNNSTDSKEKNPSKNENNKAIIIFVISAAVAGLILVTFGTILIANKIKKRNSQ